MTSSTDLVQGDGPDMTTNALGSIHISFEDDEPENDGGACTRPKPGPNPSCPGSRSLESSERWHSA